MTITLAPPNGELVSQAWVAAHTSIPAGIIAGSLPKDPDRPTPADKAKQWTRFLTVRALPSGNPDPDVTERRGTIVQIDAWGRVLNSARPPWGMVFTTLELIRAATFRDAQTYGRLLNMPVSGYQTARVLAAYLVTEPTRVEGDPSGYAHMTCDLAVDWTV